MLDGKREYHELVFPLSKRSFRLRDGFQMAAGWMRAGHPRPGRRLKAPGERNRGQRGMRYGDLCPRLAGAVAYFGAC